MANTLVNMTGMLPGIAQDETAMNVETVTIEATSKKVEIPNKSGNTFATWFFDKRKNIEISGEVTGTITATVGGILVFSNDQALGGISTGEILVDSVTLTLNREQIGKISIKATQCEDQIVGN